MRRGERRRSFAFAFGGKRHPAARQHIAHIANLGKPTCALLHTDKIRSSPLDRQVVACLSWCHG
jgi:hypothetical protein